MILHWHHTCISCFSAGGTTPIPPLLSAGVPPVKNRPGLMIRRRRGDSARRMKLLRDLASLESLLTYPICSHAITETYFQYKQQSQRLNIPQEFQPSGAIIPPPPYHCSWPSSLLIVKIWIFNIIPHHGRVWPFFKIASNIWIRFRSDHIITINHHFCYISTMELFHCHHFWLLKFEVILLFFLTI